MLELNSSKLYGVLTVEAFCVVSCSAAKFVISALHCISNELRKLCSNLAAIKIIEKMVIVQMCFK